MRKNSVKPKEDEVTLVSDRLIRPCTGYFNNTNILKNIIADPMMFNDNVAHEILTSHKKNIYSKILLIAPPEMKHPRLSRFDEAVMNAICTIYVNDFDGFSVEDVVRVMCGDIDIDVTDQKKAAVIRSIDNMRMMLLHIDCTEEYREQGIIGENEKCIISDNILSLVGARKQVKCQNKYIQAYAFNHKPILYKYANPIHQVIDVPIEVLKLDGLQATEDNIILRDYLLREIGWMKNHKSRRKPILSFEWYDSKESCYKGLFPALGYGKEYQEEHEKQWRKKKSTVIKNCLCILDGFIAKKFIYGYEVLKSPYDKRVTTGVKILLNPPK